MWRDHPPTQPKETGLQKEQLGWRVEVTGNWGRGGCTKFEKGGVSNIGGSS